MALWILYHLEGLTILGVVLLGFAWPSGMTLIALFVLPAGFMLVRAILDARWLSTRRYLHYYVHFSGILGIIGVGLFWYGTQSMVAEGETHLLPEDYTGWVLIIFNDPAGKPPLYEEERRVYQIPDDGVLRTQFPANKGSTPDGIRKYYYVTDSGDQTQILTTTPHWFPYVQNSGSGIGKWWHKGCEMHVYSYVISKRSLSAKEIFRQRSALFDNYARKHRLDCTDQKEKNGTINLVS